MFWIPNITAIMIAWFIQSAILVGYVWFDKFSNPDQSYNCWLIRGLRSIVFILFTIFSFMFIDTNIKILIFGIIGYENIYLHLASIILTFILGTEIIIGSTFVAPNRKGLIGFSAVLISFIYFWEFYLISADLNQLDFFGSKYSAFSIGILLPMLIGLTIAGITTFIEFILNRKSDRKFEDKPFWNIQKKFKIYFGLKFNLILWILITAELLLNLQGLSLLLWLTFIF
ncbi:MAG: hypothetical protein ACTSQS_06820 [Promethearchaeota archaeon]